MIGVVCVLSKPVKKIKTQYTVEWVDKLYRMVNKNLSTKFKFFCMTNEEGFKEKVIRIPFKKPWRGWWAKMELFNLNSSIGCDSLLYLDLDTLIVSSLDPIFSWFDSQKISVAFAKQNAQGREDGLIWEKVGKTRVNKYNTSTFIFSPGKTTPIFNLFYRKSNYYQSTFHGDQDFLGYFYPNMITMPQEWFSRIGFEDYNYNPNRDNKVKVVWCIKYKNDEVLKTHDWIKEVWK